jgi:hypothetical protein
MAISERVALRKVTTLALRNPIKRQRKSGSQEEMKIWPDLCKVAALEFVALIEEAQRA